MVLLQSALVRRTTVCRGKDRESSCSESMYVTTSLRPSTIFQSSFNIQIEDDDNIETRVRSTLFGSDLPILIHMSVLSLDSVERCRQNPTRLPSRPMVLHIKNPSASPAPLAHPCNLRNSVAGNCSSGSFGEIRNMLPFPFGSLVGGTYPSTSMEKFSAEISVLFTNLRHMAWVSMVVIEGAGAMDWLPERRRSAST